MGVRAIAWWRSRCKLHGAECGGRVDKKHKDTATWPIYRVSGLG